jgi:hypothetical protein
MEQFDQLQETWSQRVRRLNAIANEKWSRSERIRKIQEEASECATAVSHHFDRRATDQDLLEEVVGLLIVGPGVLDLFDETDVAAAWETQLQRFERAIAAKELAK